MEQQIAKKQSGITESWFKLVNADLTANDENLKLSADGKKCLIHAVMKIKNEISKKGGALNSINQQSLINALTTAATLELDVAACPAECYVVIRGDKVELAVEGSGNDKIVRRFGVGVKTLHSPWLVRENDEFVFPRHEGTKIIPPQWTETHKGKVVMVVYPITFVDGREEYYISTREEVVRNLQAHISQNLMNSSQKEQIMSEIKDMTLNEILSNDKYKPHMSPAWKSAQSQEAMLIRKMRNNALKSVDKEFNSSYLEERYESTFEDYDQYRKHDSEIKEYDLREPEPKAISTENMDLVSEIIEKQEQVEKVEEEVQVTEEDFMDGVF